MKNMDKLNTAYDLSLFEDNPRVRKKKNNVVKIPRKKIQAKRKRRLNSKTVLCSAVISAIIVSVFSIMVYSQIQLTELTDKINTVDKTLAESQSTYTQMKMRAESKYSLPSVEEYVENELFMKKVEPSQIEYIALSNGDKGELKNRINRDSIFDKIKNLF